MKQSRRNKVDRQLDKAAFMQQFVLAHVGVIGADWSTVDAINYAVRAWDRIESECQDDEDE